VLDDLQTGKVIGSTISSEAFVFFSLWKFRAEPSPAMCLEFQTALPPMPSTFQSKKLPLSLRIPRCCLWYGMDIFRNHPINKFMPLPQWGFSGSMETSSETNSVNEHHSY